MNFKFDIKRFFPSKNTSDADVINASPVGTKSKLKSIAVLAKANLLLFTLALISILAFGAALYFSNELQNKNNKEAQIFGEKLVALSKLEQTQVTIRIPGNDDINEKVLVTERLVDAVKAKMPSEASNQGNSIQLKEFIIQLRICGRTQKLAESLLMSCCTKNLSKNMTSFLHNVILVHLSLMRISQHLRRQKKMSS